MNNIQRAIELQARLEAAGKNFPEYYDLHLRNQAKLARDVIEAGLELVEESSFFYKTLRTALNAWADHVNGEGKP